MTGSASTVFTNTTASLCLHWACTGLAWSHLASPRLPVKGAVLVAEAAPAAVKLRLWREGELSMTDVFCVWCTAGCDGRVTDGVAPHCTHTSNTSPRTGDLPLPPTSSLWPARWICAQALRATTTTTTVHRTGLERGYVHAFLARRRYFFLRSFLEFSFRRRLPRCYPALGLACSNARDSGWGLQVGQLGVQSDHGDGIKKEDRRMHGRVEGRDGSKAMGSAARDRVHACLGTERTWHQWTKASECSRVVNKAATGPVNRTTCSLQKRAFG